MMRGSMGAALASVVLTGSVAGAGVALAPAANAANPANPGCATRAEFQRIHTGQSLDTVARIVGSRGKVNMASPYLTIRQWKTCPNPYGNMTIGFSGGRVQSKLFIA